jgi:3-phenylpropionate/trans-cinnamate dioxygenase ferredoxin subunit
MAFVTAAKVGDIPCGKGKQVEIAGKTLALFNSNGTYYAIDGICTHRSAPLAEGDCAGDVVCCPWHGAHFSLTTGAHLSPPATRGVKAYPVQVVGDEIQIDV